MTDETRIRKIEKEVEVLIKHLADQTELHNDLIDYLERTDPNFENKPQEFENWQERLHIMKRTEEEKHNIKKAKRLLESEGYIVAANENEVDAEKLKHWVNSKDKEVGRGAKRHETNNTRRSKRNVSADYERP